jgi:tetratricopeptide (TPR) repeat protein
MHGSSRGISTRPSRSFAPETTSSPASARPGTERRQGRHEEAAQLAEQSRSISSADDLDAQPRWRAALARALTRRGERVEGERLAREALELLEPTDFIFLQAEVLDLLAEILVGRERVDEAVGALEHALALHEQKGNLVSAGRSRAALEELRAPAS